MCRNYLHQKVERLVSIQSFFKNLRQKIKAILEIVMFMSNNKLYKLSKILERIADLSLYDKRKRKTSEKELIGKTSKSTDMKELGQIC